MNHVIAIAAGGAVGALLRFWVSTEVYALLGRAFPYGTLAVNVLGSWIMGALYAIMLERVSFGVEVRAFFLIGLLGSFTTFSTFSLETLNLLEQGEVAKAVANALMNLLLCLTAAWFGVIMGRQL